MPVIVILVSDGFDHSPFHKEVAAKYINDKELGVEAVAEVYPCSA